MDRVNVDLTAAQYAELRDILDESAQNFAVDALNEIDEGYEVNGQRCETMLDVFTENAVSYTDPGPEYESVQDFNW